VEILLKNLNSLYVIRNEVDGSEIEELLVCGGRGGRERWVFAVYQVL